MPPGVEVMFINRFPLTFVITSISGPYSELAPILHSTTNNSECKFRNRVLRRMLAWRHVFNGLIYTITTFFTKWSFLEGISTMWSNSVWNLSLEIFISHLRSRFEKNFLMLNVENFASTVVIITWTRGRGAFDQPIRLLLSHNWVVRSCKAYELINLERLRINYT